MLDKFFISDTLAYPLLWVQHDPWLVALSVLMAVLASSMALQMAALARRADTGVVHHVARASGAVALGAGIWSMHFIGMLAFTVCAAGQVDPLITVLSMLPSLLASWTALGLLMRREVSRTDLVLCGVLVGGGIGAMHYIGMAASQWAPVMRYDPWGFATSVVVAVLLAVVALWVRFGMGQVLRWSEQRLNWAAGGVMGLGISSMHYTGMAALRFIDAPDVETLADMPGNASLALSIALVVIAIGLLVVALNVGLRYRQMYLQLEQSESRLRAIAETAVDGIVLIDSRGCVQSFNGAAERLLGWQAHEVVGRNVSVLVPEPDQSQHDGYLQRYLQGGGGRLVGAPSRDVQAQHRDGTLVPVRLSVGRVPLEGDPLFVGFMADLRQHRAMEGELQRHAQQLQSLMANIPGVTFRCRHDGDWSMLLVSDAVGSLTGWRPQDFLEARVHFSQLILSEDAPRLWNEVSEAIEQGRPYHVEYRIVDKQGCMRWVSESGRPMMGSDGAVQWIDGVIMDMTPFKQRNAEFESTVRAINRALAVVEFDLEGRVISANANFLDLVGYRLDEVVGRHHRLFCEPASMQEDSYAQFWTQLRSGELKGGEYLRLGKDGQRIWIQATYNPIFDAQGKPFKVVEFATDLSERRAMEQELRAAKDRAEQAAAARSTFLANMSHEIRTPMNAIIGFTEALLETPLNPQQQRHMGTVHRAARSMLRLLNDILDTAKLDKGAVELEIADFSLPDLCDQTLASLRILAARKGLDLQCRRTDRVPTYLRGDALRLQQILLNLLGNALKFTEHGQVLLHLDYQDGHVLMEVRDTGIGIAAEQLERIFDPFAQADASTTRQFGGTGLGTTISRQLVEIMGGSIAVRSALGVGSVFTVRVPLPIGHAGAAQTPAATPGRLPPLRILVVDDVPANIELLQIHLEPSGHQVSVACDGAEAFQLFCAGRFDVVLMDLQMPGMDGLEATRCIRAFEEAQQRAPTPIVALSASVLEQDQRNAREAGMNGFASKPLEPARLFSEMARVLRLGPAAAVATSPPARPRVLPAAVPAAASAAGAQTPIDWGRGLALWQQRKLLDAAIARFAQEHADAATALQAQLKQENWHALRALAHRLAGAAGNLALPSLHRLAQKMEDAALARDTAAMASLVDAWAPALQALEHALAGAAPAAAADQSGAKPAVLTNAQRTQARAAESVLTQALERSELAQEPLDTLAQLLPATALEALHDAIDRFDFDQALSQLVPLRTHWADLPLENRE